MGFPQDLRLTDEEEAIADAINDELVAEWEAAHPEEAAEIRKRLAARELAAEAAAPIVLTVDGDEAAQE